MVYDTCKDDALEMIEEYSKDFIDCIIDDEKYQKIERACELVDGTVRILITDDSFKELHLYLDPAAKSFAFKIYCDEIEMHSGDPIFELIDLVDRTRFSKLKDDLMQIEFTVSDLWIKVFDDPEEIEDWDYE